MIYLRLLGSALAFASVIKAQVDLGTALSFAVLGGSAVTNTGPSIISGNLGVYPGSAISGFPPGIVVNGVIHMTDAVAAQAQADVTTAYNVAAGLPPDTDLTGQDLGGMTLVAGVYHFSTSAQLTGALILDGQGDSSSVWVFQIGTTLTTATASSVILINGASPCNIFWQVGSSATIGTTTTFVGNVLALTSITLVTGASSNGGLYARNGAVTLDTNNVNAGLDCPPLVVTTTTTTTTATATETTTTTTTATDTDTATTTTTTTDTDTATTTTTTTATDTTTDTDTTTTTATYTTTRTNTRTASITNTAWNGRGSGNTAWNGRGSGNTAWNGRGSGNTAWNGRGSGHTAAAWNGRGSGHTAAAWNGRGSGATAATWTERGSRTATNYTTEGPNASPVNAAMFGITGRPARISAAVSNTATTIRTRATAITFTATCHIAPTTITSYGQDFFIGTPCTTVLTATVGAAFGKPASCKECNTPIADDGEDTTSTGKLWPTDSHESVLLSQATKAATESIAHFQWNESLVSKPAASESQVIVTAGARMNWPNLTVIIPAVFSFFILNNLL